MLNSDLKVRYVDVVTEGVIPLARSGMGLLNCARLKRQINAEHSLATHWPLFDCSSIILGICVCF